VKYCVYRSPVGKFLICVRKGRLCALSPVKGEAGEGGGDDPVQQECKRQLDEYFAGERRTFSLPTDLSALTPFQRRVLTLLRDVPYGTTVSYGELARRAGVPGGARAVGGVMRRNPLPIIYPCHRVIRSDGVLGGFGLGGETKAALLEMERRACREGR